MGNKEHGGRVTIPTNLDVVPETIELMKRWGADAIRDCDGTEFPEELTKTGAKIYATYYTTRKDNAWAKANPDEVQQSYIMTNFYTATGNELQIPLMKGISDELMQVNTRDDRKRWWEVIDRSTGEVVSTDKWEYNEETGCVCIHDTEPFHEYTVSFLAYIIWDPVHMYNAVTNGWKDFEHQITFDVRQPKTHKYSMERLRKYCAEHPYVNVIRYTTFFHQFTLVFDELKREKFVDWYGYSSSVSPYILEQFEREVGYKFRPEFIIDQGYHNNQYRVPSKEYKDFQAFQRREVAKLAKEMVDIGDPVKEAKENWVTARRAILRKPIDRIGYGGYLKLALEFPEFLDYVESVCNEFRELYENAKGTTPYCVKKVAVLNSWGKIRSWGCHMVHHALYQKQNYSYAGIIEALSGAPFDVKFISFDDILENEDILKDIDVIINVGDGDTAHTGGAVWENPVISSAIRRFVYEGGGFIGIGEPAGHQYQGHYLQLADLIGVEKETGFTLNYDKYNWDEHPDHFILADTTKPVDFGEGKKSIYAYEGTEILVQRDKEVQMAVNGFGAGRSVYISGLPYSFENSRILYRSILWSTHSEDELHQWYSTNFNVEVHAYVKNGKFCVVNNTYEPQNTVIYRGDGSSFALKMEANEIKWYAV